MWCGGELASQLAELTRRSCEKRCSARGIAPRLVREADGELSQRTPQRLLGSRRALPPGFENLVRLEGIPGVEQSLGVREQSRRIGLEPRRVEFLEGARSPVGQWPSQAVARTIVEWPPAGVPVAAGPAHSSQLSSSELKVCGASSWG